MRIAFIADWRSPTARNWVRMAAGMGHECLVLSSFPYQSASYPTDSGIRVCQVPIALACLRRARRSPGLLSTQSQSTPAPHQFLPGRLRRTLGSASTWIAPYDLERHAKRANRIFSTFSPDIVHVLRIPYEGMFATTLKITSPLVVSVWGIDFTLIAPTTRKLRLLTRTTMRRADGLMADCHADVARALDWGLPPSRPTIVLPGGGGIDLGSLDRTPSRADAKRALGIDPERIVILNPRGDRQYIPTAVYCTALHQIATRRRDTFFVFADMARNAEVARSLRQLGIAERTMLLPKLDHGRMIDLFAAADVSVSPSLHDGTPNSLLEAMAAGCLPVVGDIPSVREWIEPRVNGLVCNPLDPADIANAVLSAIEDQDLARAAATRNRALIQDRASREHVAAAADGYYRSLLRRPSKVKVGVERLPQ
ncbi:glycosyltransferase [Parafrankia sp. FMc6]|uniref:glycosyltransferase n=1 Tax=Parafrankia soli TaxID=2599596 RepID=UPI0034D57EF3